MQRRPDANAQPGYEQDVAPGQYEGDVDYVDYSQTGFDDEEYSDYSEELDDTHRFRVAMNVFDLISVIAGLAVILLLVAILVSLVSWLEGDIAQSFTMLTAQFR